MANNPKAIGVLAAAMILGVSISIVGLFLSDIPTYGEKEEEGIRVAYGVITYTISVHGGDWTIWLDNKQCYEFPYGTFGVENHPRIGTKMAIAYEWKKLYHEDCLGPPYNRHYYWAPVILDWEVLD